jgi:5-oxoprolinase (ATP-hydrolysing) subunit B
VLVSCDDAATLRRVLTALGRVVPLDDSVGARDVIEIGVEYDGADLAWVAATCGLTEPAVVALHSAPEYTVAFCGFAPGFGYLRGLDPRLHLPRRSTPRATVPSGSVAIASEFAAVYPRSSPGGWHLLGRTELSLFDPHRDPPSLVAPGTRVRFVPR